MLRAADRQPNKVQLNPYAVCAGCDDTEDSWKVGDGGSGDDDDEDGVLVDLDLFFLCKIYNSVVAVQILYLTVCLMAVTEDLVDLYVYEILYEDAL